MNNKWRRRRDSFQVTGQEASAASFIADVFFRFAVERFNIGRNRVNNLNAVQELTQISKLIVPNSA